MDQMLIQRCYAWSGPIAMLLFFFGLLFSGFIPPLSPSMTQEQVVLHYQQHTTGIRVGMSLILLSGMFYAAFTAVMSGQMRRIPGVSPTLIYGQLAGGSFACLTFLVPAIFFLVTAYRPDRPASETFLMNDLAWFTLVIPWPPFMVQNFSFALGILADRRPQPLFPRWYAYLNIWAPITFTPGALLSFFKSGPFAWNGIFVFWLPGAIFFFWFFATAILLQTAIRTEGHEPAPSNKSIRDRVRKKNPRNEGFFNDSETS